MTWTYSEDPSASSKDAVRFLLGDIDSADQLISDEGINFLLAQTGEPYSAAAAAAEQIAAQMAREVPYSADGVSISSDILMDKFLALAAAIRAAKRRMGKVALPYAGGIDVSDVERHDKDQSVVHTDFGTGMHDHREAGSTSYTGVSKSPLVSENY